MSEIEVHYDIATGGDLAGHYARGESRPITVVGNPVLHEPCADVTEFGEELARLVSDMFVSMRTAHGVGLAANQIGVPLRVFVYLCPESYERRENELWHAGHVVNPVVEVTGAEAGDHAEGCLSVPGAQAVSGGRPRSRSVVSTWRATRSWCRHGTCSPAASSTRPTTSTAASTSTTSPRRDARPPWPR